MRRNLYILAQCTFLLFITLLVNGCSLHEEPEMTPEGELGVDPTAVTLNLNLAMNLSLAERAPVTITRASETNYLRRIIVEAYLDRQVAARQTVYEEDFNRASLSVSMKLHARNYRILVWADYVNAETPEQGLVYDAKNLAFILPAGKYIGNSRYKDVFAASAMADLTSFRNHWGAETSLDVELYRPVARYELVAKDVATFLNKLSTGGLKGESFTARVKYSDYLPTGYNLWDDVPKNSLMYMEYKVAFERPADGTKELILGFDYVLTDAGETVSIPVLRKDFTVDPYMSNEAKVLGATAVLLICALLPEVTLKEYLETAHSLGLSALVEAHDEAEVAQAMRAGARIIGVNNRNLKDFTVDIHNSERLRELVPENIVFVSESGIKTPEDVGRLYQNKTDAVLIGETLMRSSNKKAELEKLSSMC